MRKISKIILLITGIAVMSCDSETAPDCFKKTGEIIEQKVDIAAFHTIVVYDEMDVYLSNATDQEVVIRAGKNLVPEISLNVDGGVLSITNSNSCNWRRSPGNPGIYIGSNNLERIEIFDFSNFYTVDTLMLDQLEIYSDGTGNFELALSVDSLWVESVYISNFNLSGRVDYLNINLTDDSQFFAKDLISNDIRIRHRSSNRVELYPVNSMKGTMESTGNLYYFNAPAELDISISNTGKLFDYSE